jgi:hypothetical protein
MYSHSIAADQNRPQGTTHNPPTPTAPGTPHSTESLNSSWSEHIARYHTQSPNAKPSQARRTAPQQQLIFRVHQKPHHRTEKTRNKCSARQTQYGERIKCNSRNHNRIVTQEPIPEGEQGGKEWDIQTSKCTTDLQITVNSEVKVKAIKADLNHRGYTRAT